MFFGFDHNDKNIIVLCRNGSCNSAFGNDYLVFLDALDTSIDGVANGTDGNVVCVQEVDGCDPNTWIAKVNSSSTVACNSAKAIVYYFDSKRE